MIHDKKTRVGAFVILASVLACAAGAPFASAGQTTAAQSRLVKKPQVLLVTNYVLRLPDAYLVYEPGRDVLQIAAMGTVLSYGEDWERRQVKPFLFHLRHRSWKNHFWKVNTSRREVYLVWGGLFGRIGTKPGAAAREVDGDREDIRLEVVGGEEDRTPQRFLIRFADADLYFDPVGRGLRLSAAGTTLSPCDDWEACSLKEYLFHVRLKTWKGFFWKVNTSRLGAWRTAGADFCELGGEDKDLPLTMKSFKTSYSMARLRTTIAAVEKARLKRIARMIEAGRPLADIKKASADFVREFPGVDVDAAVSDLAAEIKELESTMEEIRKKRQEFETAFENFDQKANQLFNILSTVMKTMKEAEQGITRNLL